MLSIERVWREAHFRRNDRQRQAILHGGGPLYLPAGTVIATLRAYIEGVPSAAAREEAERVLEKLEEREAGTNA